MFRCENKLRGLNSASKFECLAFTLLGPCFFFTFEPAYFHKTDKLEHTTMKKTSLTLLLSLVMLSAASAQVVITEIMYNPPESGTDSLEYLELHNNSNAAVNISGWNFTQGIEHIFPAGTIMPAGGYISLAKSANAFQLVFGFAPTVWTNGALTNSPGEDIELRDANSNVIDFVDYLNAAPWPLEANGMGSSLVLCDFNGDNAVATNWIAATTGTGVMVNGREVKGNPGAASGCSNPGIISATADNVFVSSGQTKVFDVLSNDLFLGTVTSMIIMTPPTQGSATVVGNKISYASNQGYCGTDQLEYKVCNATSCGTAIVTIDVRCYPTQSIASMTTENVDGVADALNQTCSLQGVVYGVNLRPVTGANPSLLFTLIDAQGNGISVSSLNGQYGYTVQEKDNITVRGIITQFNGMTEIQPDTIIKNSSNNTLVTPTPVVTHSEGTESKLIKINNLHLVDNAEWTTGMGTSGFNVHAVSDDHPNDTILIRIDRDVETYNAPVPPQPFNLTGLGGQFDGTSPYTSGYQILPRYNPDIITLVGTVIVDYNAEITLSPNPVSNILTIDMQTSFDQVTIMSALGRKVKTLINPDNVHQVDVSLLPVGTYFVRFEKGNAVWTTPFVKI